MSETVRMATYDGSLSSTEAELQQENAENEQALEAAWESFATHLPDDMVPILRDATREIFTAGWNANGAYIASLFMQNIMNQAFSNAGPIVTAGDDDEYEGEQVDCAWTDYPSTDTRIGEQG